MYTYGNIELLYDEQLRRVQVGVGAGVEGWVGLGWVGSGCHGRTTTQKKKKGHGQRGAGVKKDLVSLEYKGR